MNSSFINDIYLTNSIVNFLHAGYQGAFAGLNLLSQLRYQHFNQEDLTLCEKALVEIDRWKDDLSRGLPIFSASWRSPQTVHSKKAFEALADLRSDLLQSSGRVKKMLLLQDPASSPEEVKYLIAAFTRQSYARENYVRGFIEFGQAFKHQDIIDSYSPFMPDAEQGISAAHMFYDIFVSQENLPPVFYTGLFEECSFLPGIFHSQVHDIHLLLNSYAHEFSYGELAINPQHEEAWRSMEVTPVAAGYWQAWEFDPESASRWLQLGLTDPKAAWFWFSQGFDPDTAFTWAQAGFSPPTARAWRAQGYSPEAALRAIEDEMLRRQEAERVEGATPPAGKDEEG